MAGKGVCKRHDVNSKGINWRAAPLLFSGTRLCKRRFQNIQRLAEDAILNGDWCEEPDDIAVHAAGEQDQSLFKGNQADPVGELCAWQLRSGIVELDGIHKARPTDVDDLRYRLAQRFEALLQPISQEIGTIAKVLVGDDVKHRMGSSDTDGIAAIGAAKSARTRRIHDLGPPGDSGKRKAARKAL